MLFELEPGAVQLPERDTLGLCGSQHVHLVQRRNGELDFSYLAIKAGTATAQAAVVPPLRLPQAAGHLLTDLPVTVCVPSVDLAELRAERPLAGQHGAALAEAGAAPALLEAGIADDQRRARAIREALDIARGIGASPTTRPAEALAQAGDRPAAA